MLCKGVNIDKNEARPVAHAGILKRGFYTLQLTEQSDCYSVEYATDVCPSGIFGRSYIVRNYNVFH